MLCEIKCPCWSEKTLGNAGFPPIAYPVLISVLYSSPAAGLKTYEDVLNLSTADIARSTKLTQSDSVTLKLAVSEKVYRQPKLTGQQNDLNLTMKYLTHSFLSHSLSLFSVNFIPKRDLNCRIACEARKSCKMCTVISSYCTFPGLTVLSTPQAAKFCVRLQIANVGRTMQM